jgi:predicted alpha/beta-hydrolase family hydrolase
MDMRIGPAGVIASRYTPKGVAKRAPMSNQRRENQSMSLQTCGINRILAITSRIRTVGTTWTGGRTIDMLVTATIAKPKPL